MAWRTDSTCWSSERDRLQQRSTAGLRLRLYWRSLPGTGSLAAQVIGAHGAGVARANWRSVMTNLLVACSLKLLAGGENT